MCVPHTSPIARAMTCSSSLQQVSDQTHQGLGKVTLNPKVHLLTNDHCPRTHAC